MGLQLTWEFEKYLSASASPTMKRRWGNSHKLSQIMGEF